MIYTKKIQVWSCFPSIKEIRDRPLSFIVENKSQLAGFIYEYRTPSVKH